MDTILKIELNPDKFVDADVATLFSDLLIANPKMQAMNEYENVKETMGPLLIRNPTTLIKLSRFC